jgi:hypothetical protein
MVVRVVALRGVPTGLTDRLDQVQRGKVTMVAHPLDMEVEVEVVPPQLGAQPVLIRVELVEPEL